MAGVSNGVPTEHLPAPRDGPNTPPAVLLLGREPHNVYCGGGGEGEDVGQCGGWGEGGDGGEGGSGGQGGGVGGWLRVRRPAARPTFRL